jgi:hypothetical protein
MEPMNSAERAAVLERNPQAEPSDIDEYERLLALRFARDPQLVQSPEEDEARREGEDRLKALHDKLFRSTGKTLNVGGG